MYVEEKRIYKGVEELFGNTVKKIRMESGKEGKKALTKDFLKLTKDIKS